MANVLPCTISDYTCICGNLNKKIVQQSGVNRNIADMVLRYRSNINLNFLFLGAVQLSSARFSLIQPLAISATGPEKHSHEHEGLDPVSTTGCTNLSETRWGKP
jgi:hypothetical protein